MEYKEIDINLTSEQKALRDMVRRFGAEVMRPIGIELDQLPRPEDVIADGSPLWEAIKKYRELGLHTMAIPKALGGMKEDLDAMSMYLIWEELGYADIGLTNCFYAGSIPFYIAALSSNPELQKMVRDYCEDLEGNIIGCWAITEPDHGSDWVITDGVPRYSPSVRGILKGDEYIINGAKSEWVSNGTIATHAMIHVCLDPSKGMEEHGVMITSLDRAGISRGKPLNKMGQRSLNQGSIIFEDVHIPKDFMIQAPRLDTAVRSATVFGGVAKAAFDEALRYSKVRIQGGVPIFEHKNVKMRLIGMFKMVEAARASARRIAMYNAANPLSPSIPHGVAAKCLSSETASAVANEAIQIFGASGLTKEYVIEKLYRDARAGMIEGGSNDALSLRAADFL